MNWEWSIDGWMVLVAILSACSCALVGNYLVLRRMSLMGDAISHAVLPGLAIAFLLTDSRAALPMFTGAVIVGVLTALLTQVITRYGKVEHGAAMGVVFSILFAVGLVLIRQAADHVDLDPGCVLYGNLANIPLDAFGGEIPPAVVNLGVVLLADLLFVLLLFKELRIASFDPTLATTLGINAQVMHYGLMVMVAVTTVANFESVGSILVIAMLIVPGATAHLLTDRLGTMIGLSLVVAIVSAVGGHMVGTFGPRWLGYDVDANSAAMMTVVAGFLLGCAVLFSPSHGVLAKWIHQRRLGWRIVQQDILGLLYRWDEMRSGEPMLRGSVLEAVGGDSMTRRVLRRLERSGRLLRGVRQGDARGLSLTDDGRRMAREVVGSHRLWEAYLAKHFALPDDHLHMPAERMEHFITPAMRAELRDDLADPTHDPHGREIPGGGAS